MATIKPRRGTSTPGAGTILQNEIAVDTTNKRIFIGAADGSGTLIGSAPGGSNTQVQFNDSGVLGGDAGFTYNKTSDTLTVTGDVGVNGGNITTTAGTASIFNDTATDVNFCRAATSLVIGSTTGTTQIRNNLQLNGQSDLRLADSDSSNYVALQAPATVSNNNTYTLPSAVGTANQVLQIASVAGNDATLTWGTASGSPGPAGPTGADGQSTADMHYLLFQAGVI